MEKNPTFSSLVLFSKKNNRLFSRPQAGNHERNSDTGEENRISNFIKRRISANIWKIQYKPRIGKIINL